MKHSKLYCQCAVCRSDKFRERLKAIGLWLAAVLMTTIVMAVIIPPMLDAMERQRQADVQHICQQGYHCDPKAGP